MLARGHAQELPVRDITPDMSLVLLLVRSIANRFPHCNLRTSAFHMRSASANGQAIGVCWGLAVLLGTARGCWGLPGMPGMRPVIEFAGDCWGLLGAACDCSNSCVPPSNNQMHCPNTAGFAQRAVRVPASGARRELDLVSTAIRGLF